MKNPESTPKGVTLSLTENTAPALPEVPGLESSLYLYNLCASLYNRCYVNNYFHLFIIKYIHFSQSADKQSLML